MAEQEEMFETAEVVAAEDADDKIFKEKDSVIGFIKDRYKRSEDSRYADEQRWLKAYRNYRGLYGSDVQFTDAEKSRIFVKVTKTKTLYKMAKYGFVTSGIAGALGYVDEESILDSRSKQAAASAVGGSILSPAIGAAVKKFKGEKINLKRRKLCIM